MAVLEDGEILADSDFRDTGLTTEFGDLDFGLLLQELEDQCTALFCG